MTAVATGMRVAVPAATTLVLARMFLPAQIGILGLYVMVTAIPVTAATLRLDDAVVISPSGARASMLTSCAAWGLIMVTIATACVVAILQLTEVLPDLPKWTWIAAGLHVMGFGCWRLECAWLLRTHRVGQWVRSDVSSVLALGAFQVGLSAIWRTPASLIWGFPLAYLSATVIGRSAVPAWALRVLWHPRAARHGWRIGRRFPIYLIPYSILGTIRDRSNIAVLRTISDSAVGFFFQADKLVALPTTIATGALRPIAQMHGATGNRQELRAFVDRSTMWLAPMVGFGVGLAAAYADLVAVTVLGQAWQPAAGYMRVLAVPGAILATTNWLDRLFHISGAQRSALVVEAAGTALVLTAVCTASAFTNDALLVVSAYAAAMTVYLIVWWAVALHRGVGSYRSLVIGLVALGITMPAGWLAGAALQRLFGTAGH